MMTSRNLLITANQLLIKLDDKVNQFSMYKHDNQAHYIGFDERDIDEYNLTMTDSEKNIKLEIDKISTIMKAEIDVITNTIICILNIVASIYSNNTCIKKSLYEYDAYDKKRIQFILYLIQQLLIITAGNAVDNMIITNTAINIICSIDSLMPTLINSSSNIDNNIYNNNSNNSTCNRSNNINNNHITSNSSTHSAMYCCQKYIDINSNFVEVILFTKFISY
jgi:hypothetical protein